MVSAGESGSGGIGGRRRRGVRIRRKSSVSGSVCRSTGLLRVLALVVLGVVSRIVLPLRVVALSAVALLSVLATVASSSSTIAALRWAITVVGLRRRDVGLPNFGSPPRRNIGTARCKIVSCRAGPRLATFSAGAFAAFAKFRHQASVLGVESAFHRGGRSMLDSVRIPVNCAVTSHVACASADTADDVRCEVTLFWAVVLAMANITTVLADLILVVAKRSVESGKFPKLVSFVIILTFGGRGSLHKKGKTSC